MPEQGKALPAGHRFPDGAGCARDKETGHHANTRIRGTGNGSAGQDEIIGTGIDKIAIGIARQTPVTGVVLNRCADGAKFIVEGHRVHFVESRVLGDIFLYRFFWFGNNQRL